MKKLAVCLIIVLSCFSLSALTFSSREQAMGYVGVAPVKTANNSFYNPAAVYYYNEQTKFFIDSYLNDSFSDSSALNYERPQVGIKGSFNGKYVNFSVGLDFDARRLAETVYAFSKSANIGVNFAAGYSDFAVGVGINAFSTRNKEDDLIQIDRTLADIVERGILSEFSRDDYLSGVKVKLGFSYLKDNFSFGLLFDDFIDSSVRKQVFDFNAIKDSVGAGFTCNTSPFSTRGRLNKWVFSADAEMRNIFCGNPVLHTGAELTLQLVKDFLISARGGVKVPLFSTDDGVNTFGFSANIRYFDLAVLTEIPFRLYKGESASGVCVRLEATFLL